MRAYVFHHGAKANTIFYSKFDVLEFLDVEGDRKKSLLAFLAILSLSFVGGFCNM